MKWLVFSLFFALMLLVAQAQYWGSPWVGRNTNDYWTQGTGYGIGYRDGQQAACSSTIQYYGYGTGTNNQDVYQKMFMYGMGYGMGYRDGQAAGCNWSIDPYPNPFGSGGRNTGSIGGPFLK